VHLTFVLLCSLAFWRESFEHAQNLCTGSPDPQSLDRVSRIVNLVGLNEVIDTKMSITYQHESLNALINDRFATEIPKKEKEEEERNKAPSSKKTSPREHQVDDENSQSMKNKQHCNIKDTD
jgi:hypothetical protein